MQTFITNSEKETKQLAAKFAKKIKGDIFALSGELGAGKTIFIQGFAKELGVKEKIISPTFVLIRQHKIPQSTKTLYHIDLYRIDENFSQLGLEEIMEDPDNIVLIEWAEKLDYLPPSASRVVIEKQDENRRLITLS